MRVLGRIALALAAAVLSALALAAPAGAAHYLYIANDDSNGTTTGYTIGSGAALTPIAAATEDAGAFPLSVVISPDAKHMYVGSFGLYGYDVAADGSLTAMTGSPFAPSQGLAQLTISPDGSRLYAAGGNSSKVYGFALASDGTPTSLPGSPYATGGTFSFGIAMTPDAKNVYSSNTSSHTISAFSVNANGSLTAVAGSPFSPGPGTPGPQFMSIDPTGRFLYAGDNDNNTVAGFAIANDGSLASIAGSPFSSGGGPWGATVSPDGKHVYVGTEGGSNVFGYAINNVTGALVALGGSPYGGGSFTRTVAITPDGTGVFAANLVGDNVTRYTRNTGTGVLTGVPPNQAAGDGATGAAITPEQAPTAGFGPTASQSRNVTFTSTSTDPDTTGPIADLTWDFGDGSAPVSTTNTDTQHTFPADGTYSVKLTATDSGGCGPDSIYTGQTLYCNGGPATITQQVNVDTVVSGATFKAKKKQKQKPDKGKVVIKAKAGAAEKVLLTVSNGKVKVPGAGKVKLKKFPQADVAAGQLAKIKLKPAGKRGTKAILGAIESGKKPKVSFKVRLEDDAGNFAEKTLKVGLK